MSDAMMQIPGALAAAGTLLTVYYVGRQGHGRAHSENGPGRRHSPLGQTKLIKAALSVRPQRVPWSDAATHVATLTNHQGKPLPHQEIAS
jgi:hypothetical protein